ncbi:MAG: zinc-binding dehydrogenase [Steroidobacteraceae bacterium]
MEACRSFGLQFAIAAGARVDHELERCAKLEHAKTLGAFATINYGAEPKWSEAVMKLTEGAGVHHVLEVGGSGTLAQSLASLAPGGHVALIGGLAGFGGDIPATALIGRNAGATGIFVGSRADFEAMNAFIVRHTLRPVVDRSFDFGAAAAAYAYMESGSHFGKIVIRH